MDSLVIFLFPPVVAYLFRKAWGSDGSRLVWSIVLKWCYFLIIIAASSLTIYGAVRGSAILPLFMVPVVSLIVVAAFVTKSIARVGATGDAGEMHNSD